MQPHHGHGQRHPQWVRVAPVVSRSLTINWADVNTEENSPRLRAAKLVLARSMVPPAANPAAPPRLPLLCIKLFFVPLIEAELRQRTGTHTSLGQKDGNSDLHVGNADYLINGIF